MLELDGHLAVHLGNLGIVLDEVPLRGELAHLLTLKVILEDDDSAGNKVALHFLAMGSLLLGSGGFVLSYGLLFVIAA